ncbi:hypothetical protein ACQ4M3_07980 [Leptolyngbya sp. AN03gr2]|uniref:hypothetical protein n=1 Tax=unclassified Leptolyngbya TaxID=2650499 RepID=UPI003D3234C8
MTPQVFLALTPAAQATWIGDPANFEQLKVMHSNLIEKLENVGINMTQFSNSRLEQLTQSPTTAGLGLGDEIRAYLNNHTSNLS